MWQVQVGCNQSVPLQEQAQLGKASGAGGGEQIKSISLKVVLAESIAQGQALCPSPRK